MKINVDELQTITTLLLARLKKSRGNTIEIASDFYWSIPEEAIYNPYKEPDNLTLGQLSDDVVDVQKLLNSDDDNEEWYYDLKKVSEIFKAIVIEYKGF